MRSCTPADNEQYAPRDEMRYPRVYILFDKQLTLPNENFFQSISASNRKIYLRGISEKIMSIEASIANIRKLDSIFLEFPSQSEILVLSGLSVVDFVAAYFSDKNPRFYWLDSAENEAKLESYIGLLSDLDEMKYFLIEANHLYIRARDYFENMTNTVVHDPERYIIDTYALGHRKIRTSLESEIRVYIKRLLSFGMLNRVDLH
jgi:hypothetical protein